MPIAYAPFAARAGAELAPLTPPEPEAEARIGVITYLDSIDRQGTLGN
jgi:hypothetical protein